MSCILCETGKPEGHPSHPEAPRCGDKDYVALWKASKFTYKRSKLIRPYSGQCVICNTGKAKKRYGSEETALRAARATDKPHMGAYYCNLCSHWHIGTQDRVGA